MGKDPVPIKVPGWTCVWGLFIPVLGQDKIRNLNVVCRGSLEMSLGSRGQGSKGVLMPVARAGIERAVLDVL